MATMFGKTTMLQCSIAFEPSNGQWVGKLGILWCRNRGNRFGKTISDVNHGKIFSLVPQVVQHYLLMSNQLILDIKTDIWVLYSGERQLLQMLA